MNETKVKETNETNFDGMKVTGNIVRGVKVDDTEYQEKFKESQKRAEENRLRIEERREMNTVKAIMDDVQRGAKWIIGGKSK